MKPRVGHWVCFIAVVLLGLSRPTSTDAGQSLVAQEPVDPENGRARIGPLLLGPRVTLSSGVDDNIFNEAQNPRSDMTLTFAPRTTWRLHLGRVRLSGMSAVEAIYFREHLGERSVNHDNAARLEFQLNRFRPYVGGSFLKSRERSSVEIDARAQRLDTSVLAGASLQVSGKTSVGIAARRSRMAFDAASSFFGQSLRQALNRTSDAASVTINHTLTPLTTLTVSADAQDDRFQFSSFRDARSLRAMPGLMLSPFALISGGVKAGYRLFRTPDPAVPDFRGFVMTADVGYTLRDLRLSVRAERDVAYSYEVVEPYYLLTGLTGTIQQVVSGTVSLTASAGQHLLEYRHVVGTAPERARTDRARAYGAGLTYTIGPDTRLVIRGDYFRRRSRLASHEYEALRVTSSLTYGF